MDRLGEIANPARGQLNRENDHSPVTIRASKFGVARRVQLSLPRQPTYLIVHTQAESGAYSRDSSRFPRGVHFLFKPPYANGSVLSLSGHAIAYRWRSLPRVHRHRASSHLKVVPVTGVLPFCRSSWTNSCAPLFSHNSLIGIIYCYILCVCVFIKLHITAQSGLVILVIICHSH